MVLSRRVGGAKAVLERARSLRLRYMPFSMTCFLPDRSRDPTVQVDRFQGCRSNPSLIELFGLTLIEAAASGLPVVATENGGPRDIVANCRNGPLVDPTDPLALAEALKAALSDFQGRLTSETVRLLADYRMQPGAGRGRDAGSVASRTLTLAPWVVATAAVLGAALAVQRRRVVVRRRRRARRQRQAARRRRDLPRSDAADARFTDSDPGPDRARPRARRSPDQGARRRY